MWGGNWRKIMQNEENRGLFYKKASEDQLVTFYLCIFGDLPLFSLSLTLGHLEFLEHFGIWARKTRKQEKGGSKQGGAGFK